MSDATEPDEAQLQAALEQLAAVLDVSPEELMADLSGDDVEAYNKLQDERDALEVQVALLEGERLLWTQQAQRDDVGVDVDGESTDGEPSEEVRDEAAPVVTGGATAEEVIRLQGDVERLTAALEATRSQQVEGDVELRDRLIRQQADFENYRKRMRAQVDAAEAAGTLKTIKALVPVLDTLDQAITHQPDDQGFVQVRAQLLKTLESAGVEAIDPTGEVFDPAYHEAITVREGGETGVVAEVFRVGYRAEETVLRAAQVIVFS